MIKQFIAAATLAATTLLAPASAFASSSYQEHLHLANVIKSAGVSVYVNHPVCATTPGVLGMYSGERRGIVICQENGTAGGAAVAWTEEDYDTLRHEAQHFIQDCMVGTSHDHVLGAVYKDPIALAASILSEEEAYRIVGRYQAQGATEQVLVLELEAFAVARMNDPIEQAADVARYCLG